MIEHKGKQCYEFMNVLENLALIFIVQKKIVTQNAELKGATSFSNKEELFEKEMKILKDAENDKNTYLGRELKNKLDKRRTIDKGDMKESSQSNESHFLERGESDPSFKEIFGLEK